MESVIVFSHLRWNFVYQRPQHLLSRLSKHYRVLFIEEPELCSGKASVKLSSPLPNLTVCTPCTPIERPGFHDEQMPTLRQLVREQCKHQRDTIAWFYTPMALPLLDEIDALHVVYDCMDELSAFKNPPPRMAEFENALLARADIVFTGGPSLYEAKKDRHSTVHCFPSSVDLAHFRQALDRNIAYPALRSLARPRLGYYGVIDERFDVDLVARIADTHPGWQIVLVGPVAKVDPAMLPSRHNIHYMGFQPYSALPQFLAAWDVCLMPFRLNEATRFISPTKSLEYMAAEPPIVSTPIKDVVDPHGDVVDIANSPEEYIAACERALNMQGPQMQQKIRLMRERLAHTSWNTTAAQMHALLEQLDHDEPVDNEMFAALSSSREAARIVGVRV